MLLLLLLNQIRFHEKIVKFYDETVKFYDETYKSSEIKFEFFFPFKSVLYNHRCVIGPQFSVFIFFAEIAPSVYRNECSSFKA